MSYLSMPPTVYTYTVRFAHLHSESTLKVGQSVTRGTLIGIMGNTGQSTGTHLHIDVVKGSVESRYTLSDIAEGIREPSVKQLNHFLTDDLYKVIQSTPYMDKSYEGDFGKAHPAVDAVCGIVWNRSGGGIVVRKAYESTSYGHVIQIVYKTETWT